MKKLTRVSFLVCTVFVLLLAPQLWAQCNAHVAAILDEEMQTFDAYVRTSDLHCPADGAIIMRSNPMGAALFGPGHEPMYISSFFDVFTTADFKEYVVYSTYPPGQPFELVAEFQFDDPAVYPSQVVVIPVIRDPATGQIFHPSPCWGEQTPPFMLPMTASCFKVCNRTYHVDLGSEAQHGRPIVRVNPGCGYDTSCDWDPCVPGDTSQVFINIEGRGGTWWLDFTYAVDTQNPLCFCVSYIGNLPSDYELADLAALDRETQTLYTSIRPQGNYGACGTMEMFSYPPGAYIGETASPDFIIAGGQGHIRESPTSRGAFQPGDTLRLITYVNYGLETCPDYRTRWMVEHVTVMPDGGLITVDRGGECTNGGGSIVPPVINYGQPECLIVCHDVYYIPLHFPGMGIPEVTITPGCGPFTSCMSPIPCNPGNPWDYISTVYRVGGTWMLRFEYSNPTNEPACYCAEISNITPWADEAHALASPIRESPSLLRDIESFFDIWLVGRGPSSAVSGRVTVHSNPPGVIFEYPADSFFDLFTIWRPIRVIMEPSVFIEGTTYQVIAEIEYFGPGSDPFEGEVLMETAIIEDSVLVNWDPVDPCVPIVPPMMNAGESQCFVVCHDIYDVLLNAPPGSGEPIIQVEPGCEPPTSCMSPAPCMPGGPFDYVYYTEYDGINWHLIFEYSNELIEPVCYCVRYEGNLPPCTTHELAALDEMNQTLDVSVAVTSPNMECPTDGWVTAFSDPPGADIFPGSILFEEVGADWHTMGFMVGPGSFPPGATFQLIAHVDYTEPDYPDRWLVEHVLVTADDPPRLMIHDAGGECSNGAEIVPPELMPGQAACFHVCHRVYHVWIHWPYPTVPPITVSPGCFGPEVDRCLPDPNCIPGGIWDYRWSLMPGVPFWQLEFEYSNPGIEPVCYCVSVGMPPCDPVTDLVAYYDYSEMQVPTFYLYWTAPQVGVYQVWSTVFPNHTPPPGPDWVLEAVLPLPPGPAQWIDPVAPQPPYKNYVIICDCGPQ